MSTDDLELADDFRDAPRGSTRLSGAFMQFAEIIGRRLAERWRAHNKLHGGQSLHHAELMRAMEITKPLVGASLVGGWS